MKVAQQSYPDDMQMADVSDGAGNINDDSSVNGSDLGQAPGQQRAEAALRERASLVAKDTKAVKRMRLYLWAFLAVAAGLLGWGTFTLTRDVEENDFESRFASIALTISDSFVDAVERKLGALDALSVSITSHALKSGDQFPMVTLPDYEVQAGNTRILADGVYVFWLPWVQEENRTAWEQYAAQNYKHLYSSFGNELGLRMMQDQQFGYGVRRRTESEAEVEAHPAESYSSRNLQAGAFETFIPTIWNFQGPEQPGNGPFFPLWQMSPVLPLAGLLNFNFVAFEGDGILNELSNSKQAIIGGVALNLTDAETTTASEQAQDEPPMSTEDLVTAYLSMGQYRHEAASFQADPLTPVAYPVFDGWGPNKSFVGGLYTSVYWRLLFQDILPGDVRGVICVLQNTGGFAEGGTNDPPFSFRLDGPEAIFLGVGDLHDPEYDDMRVTYDVVKYIEERAGPDNRAYTTVPLNAEYNTYILSIYPSDDMKEEYVTNEPYFFTAVIVGVFLFVLLSFLAYDWFVERRQKKVLDRAVKSGTLVNTLFPEAVRDQLYQDMEKDLKKKKKKEWEVSEELSKSIELMVNGDDDHMKKKSKNRVIANKYPATTVFFMDLAGFTQWSSSREPEEVFMLLETLYGAYDAIAARRKVFKVESKSPLTGSSCFRVHTKLILFRKCTNLFLILQPLVIGKSTCCRDCPVFIRMSSCNSYIKQQNSCFSATWRLRVSLNPNLTTLIAWPSLPCTVNPRRP